MEPKKAIEILDALASGFSPTTGEQLNESVLNEREVIRALQIAIDSLQANTTTTVSTTEISEEEIDQAISIFKEHGQSATPTKLAGFFSGTRKFKIEGLTSNELYGKYSNIYQKGQLLDFSEQRTSGDSGNRQDPPAYRQIEFFQNQKFNRLSERAIDQLKEKVKNLGILKTENLSDYILAARVSYPRAYESWSEEEKVLLKKAMEYTNDLDLLSECFQRGKGSIETCGQRIIFESQNSINGGTTDRPK